MSSSSSSSIKSSSLPSAIGPIVSSRSPWSDCCGSGSQSTRILSRTSSLVNKGLFVMVYTIFELLNVVIECLKNAIFVLIFHA